MVGCGLLEGPFEDGLGLLEAALGHLKAGLAFGGWVGPLGG